MESSQLVKDDVMYRIWWVTNLQEPVQPNYERVDNPLVAQQRLDSIIESYVKDNVVCDIVIGLEEYAPEDGEWYEWFSDSSRRITEVKFLKYESKYLRFYHRV